MDYTVSEYQESDSDQIAELHSGLIGGGPRLSRRYLDWKYRQNPFITSPLVFVVRQGEDIVGMRGLYGTRWTLGPGKEPVVLPHADDLIIHPEHRNRGLFLLLHQATVAAARECGFPAILSLSGGATTQQLSLVCGYRALGELDKHSQPIGSPSTIRRVAGRAVREFRGRGVSSALSSGLVMTHICRGFNSSRSEMIEVTHEADYTGMSDVAQSTEPCRSDRSDAFFRWRLRNPDRVYRFVYWRDPHLRGYLVLAWDPTLPHRVMIADHAADDGDVLAALLSALGRRDDLEYVMMASTLSDSDLRQAEAAGFVVDPHPSEDDRRRFLYFPLDPAGDLLAPDGRPDAYPDGWSLSLLDTMAS